tara:strand:- start:1608 stop:1973 length:366 start_codon:yes stop_codon:yes gene_type:complete
MFDVIKRWVSAADPVHVAGWCGEPRKPLLSTKLTHEGGTNGDLKVIEFCDEHFGTTFAGELHRRTKRHEYSRDHGHICEEEYIEECNEDFATVNRLAMKKLQWHSIDVVNDHGENLLEFDE